MSELNNYTDRNLFDAGGHTGNIYYIRIVRRDDSYTWSPSDEILVDPASVSWSSTIILLEEKGSTGIFPIVIPKSLPADIYDVVVYKQLGSNPQNTDDVENEWSFAHGSIFGF